MKTLKLSLLFLLFGIGNLFGQNPTTDQLIQEFFTIYEAGKPLEAIDFLYSSNSPNWLEKIQADIDEVKEQFNKVPEIVGAYYGKELLIEEDLGTCFKTIIYLVKYDRQPIRFIFQYYKPLDKWRLYGFSYDDKILENFKEQVRLKLIKP